MYNDDFSVEKLEIGKRDEFRVRWCTYRVISKLPEEKVKDFCINKLPPMNLEKDKDNLFAHEIVEFKNTTNNNNPKMGDMYIYRIKKETTD